MAMRSHRSTAPLEPWRISCSSTWRFLEGRIGGSSWVSHHELPRIHMVMFLLISQWCSFFTQDHSKNWFSEILVSWSCFQQSPVVFVEFTAKEGLTTPWEYSTHIPITSHHLGSRTLDDETLNFPILREIFVGSQTWQWISWKSHHPVDISWKIHYSHHLEPSIYSDTTNHYKKTHWNSAGAYRNMTGRDDDFRIY